MNPWSKYEDRHHDPQRDHTPADAARRKHYVRRHLFNCKNARNHLPDESIGLWPGRDDLQHLPSERFYKNTR